MIGKKAIERFIKMRKRHRKNLMKLVKEDEDFDWQFLHNLVCIKIIHMLEYYLSGDNVWQSEEDRLEVLKSLTGAKILMQEIENSFSAVDKFKEENPDWQTSLEKGEEFKKLVEQAIKAEQQNYECFYNYIGEHIREWWD